MDDMIFRMMRLKARVTAAPRYLDPRAGSPGQDQRRSGEVGGRPLLRHQLERRGLRRSVGGACLISLYAGKGGDEETPDDRYMAMVGELVEWFTRAADEEYGGTRCDEILEKFPDRSICGLIVAETYRKCMDILVSHGFDPAVGKNG